MAREKTDDRLAETAAREAANLMKLVAEATRLGVMLALVEGEASATDLLPVAEGGSSALTAHLNKLVVGGLVARRREGRLVIYSLTDLGRELVAAVHRLVD